MWTNVPQILVKHLTVVAPKITNHIKYILGEREWDKIEDIPVDGDLWGVRVV